MNRSRWVAVLVLIAAAGISIRAFRVRWVQSDPSPLMPRAAAVVPAGTYVKLRIVEGILQNGKVGETFQALTAEPLVAGSQLAIPANTRAAFHIDSTRKESGDSVSITIHATQLIFSNRTISIDTAPLSATIRPVSALNLMLRSAAGMLGAAVSTAGRVSRERDSIGADAFEGAVAGSGSAPNAFEVFGFRITQPVDLTGVRW